MNTVRLTMAQALVRWLMAQRTEIDGAEVPLFPGVFAIFGHGNVTCLSEALEAVKDELPTWRGQNEQSMALAAIGFAKAKARRQIMVAASSIGPGATNMVTAAGVAHTNRLPVLLLSGDYYVSRLPDPGAAAGRALGRPDAQRQRRLQAGHPLLGPDHPAGAAAAVPAPGAGRAARPGRLRPGLPRPVPGRAGRGVRLSRSASSSHASTTSRARAPTCASSSRPRPSCARPGSRC